MKVEFDTEELGLKIVKLVCENHIDDNIPSNVIWDNLLEELFDFEYMIYDEVVKQLEDRNIKVVEW